MSEDTKQSIYTAVSFSPVQSFIEKSRKLRDLYGASGILSYLAQELIKAAPDHCELISPGLIDTQQGTPNRILFKGDYPRNDATQTLLNSWQTVVDRCRIWIEDRLKDEFPHDIYNWKTQWDKWGRYHWEVFWGHGGCPVTAMKDLETRKLRRDWIGVNWVGESSSLSGSDAIAWPQLGVLESKPGCGLTRREKDLQERFYERLAAVLENEQEDPAGKFLAVNERLSIPELIKRLITRHDIARQLHISELEQGFTDIHRNTRDQKGQWTGWFMGDGDKMGDFLQNLAANTNDQALKDFSQAMREWGKSFTNSMPQEKGRVVYAGGDDFLGVLFGQRPDQPIPPREALEWLMGLNDTWQQHGYDITLSVGFVWASPKVPQRDVLQHCREAQKKAKQMGRDRVTIRILFGSGQFVQWTCRWCDLEVLKAYRDRNGKQWDQNPNWAHIYGDWAHLKARHAVPTKTNARHTDDRIAIEFLDLYFPGYGDVLTNQSGEILGANNDLLAMTSWIEGAIQVGWYLTPTQST